MTRTWGFWPISAPEWKGLRWRTLLQPPVFPLGLGKHGDTGVGILPQREEIHVGSAGLEDFSLHGISPGEAEMRQRPDGLIGHDSPPINNPLELRRRPRTLLCG